MSTVNKTSIRLIGTASAALLITAGLTSCASEGAAAWTPDSWRTIAITQIEEVPEQTVIESSEVQGLFGQRTRHSGIGIQARFSYLASNDEQAMGFNNAVDAVVKDAIDERAAIAEKEYFPRVGTSGVGLANRGCVTGSTLLSAEQILSNSDIGPADGQGTAIVCDIVVASGPILAERIRVVSTTADGISDHSSTIYVNTETGLAGAGAALWTETAAEELRGILIDDVRRKAGSLSIAKPAEADEQQVKLLQRALNSTQPGPDGSLIITIPAGFKSPELEALGIAQTQEPISYSVAAGLIDELGSELGKQIAAGVGDGEYTGPAAALPGNRWVNCDLVPCVAVTYDDGPSGELTPQLLDTLKSKDVPATFFVLGDLVNVFPEIVKRAVDEGHVVASHTFNHPELPFISLENAKEQVLGTTNLIEEVTGTRSNQFRPPYGSYNKAILEAVQMPAMLWSVDTNDWRKPGPAALINEAVNGPNAGGIILFHDIHTDSVSVAPSVIDGLIERGFTLVTTTQLYNGNLPPAGAWNDQWE